MKKTDAKEAWESHLVCRNEVDEDSIQQFLSNSISLHDDGTHQIHHVHLHLLVMAVTVETVAESKHRSYSRQTNELKKKILKLFP